MSNEYRLKTHLAYIGAIAIDSNTLIWPLWKVPNAVRITAARMGTNTLMSAADTNYNTFSIKNGATTVATLANGPVAGGVTIAAGAMGNFTVVTAAGANEVAADAVLTLASVKTGNGLAVVAASIQIDYYDINV